MAKVQTLKVLDIAGQKHLVEEMSPAIQELVAVYNEWNQDFVDARTKAMQLEAAKQMVQNQIGDQIRKEQKDALELAKAEDAPAETSEVVAEGLIDPADGEPLISE
jgi:hypothetical protein